MLYVAFTFSGIRNSVPSSGVINSGGLSLISIIVTTTVALELIGC